jgi:hypothetical protein
VALTFTPAVPTVTTLAELRRVTHAPMSRSLVHTDAPSLRLPEATDAELGDWQQRLNRELYACGCTSGAVTLLVALAGLAIAQFVVGVDVGSGVQQVALWITVALAAALGGKAAGLLRAQRRRRLLYGEIERTLTNRGRVSAQP